MNLQIAGESCSGSGESGGGGSRATPNRPLSHPQNTTGQGERLQGCSQNCPLESQVNAQI